MYLPESSGGDFSPAPEGTHAAICTRFIDLGTQYSEKFDKNAHEVLVSWLLADEMMSDGRPFMLNKNYTFSMHEKANFRRDLESWRGKKFEKADFGPGGFDTKNLLNKPCLLTVVHSIGESVYANVKSVSGLPKGMPRPDEVADTVYLSLDPKEFNSDVFESLGEKIKDKIKRSPEYVAIVAPPRKAQAATRAPLTADLDDEIPF